MSPLVSSYLKLSTLVARCFPRKAHYAHLVVHACLHLRGYDHESKRDAARMQAREIRILRRGGIRDPYAVE